ncbi:helix-turn-helix transcriptional regulator [Pigmentiphaga aceris]|uniref:Helix-turn-helix transcriptional regulator n=1 Tax=Pigmentiphaga aceris TaxID=1940612 RepID=A0A5C0B4H3_9BURK|nr:helix-turn-helix domain-containing protein [Pigmentiphaga aceris]QEI07711.1 helix-turn-helix transcriptional regulator [Pigmentiphaga aceris]
MSDTQPCNHAACSSRLLLDQIADKWSILILGALCQEPQRFNALKRRLDGITQKALTQSLRRLERSGIVARRVLQTSPVAVEYRVTPLGESLKKPFGALYAWTVEYAAEVEQAQQAYDRQLAEHASAEAHTIPTAPFQPHMIFAEHR